MSALTRTSVAGLLCGYPRPRSVLQGCGGARTNRTSFCGEKRKTTRTRRAISAQPELHRGRRPSPRRSRFYRPGLCGKGGRCHAKHRWWKPLDLNQNLGAHTPAPYHFGQAPIFRPPNPPERPPPVILSQKRRISSTVPPDTPGKTKPPYFFTSIGINCCISFHVVISCKEEGIS